MKLHAAHDHADSLKALIVAKLAGVSVETPEYDAAVLKAGDVKAANPLGTLPVLETEAGVVVGGAAVTHYLAQHATNKSALLGSSEYERAVVQQWVEVAAAEVALPAAAWVFPLQGKIEFNKDLTAKAQADIKRVFAALNTHLRTRSFIVGAHVTLADVALFVSMLDLFALAADAKFRKPFPNVVRWFSAVASLAAVKAVVGFASLCMVPAEVIPVEVRKKQLAAEAAAKKEAAAAAQKAAQAAQKAAAAAAKAAEADDGDEHEEKVKDPFAGLPPTSLDLEWWKRCYSNNPAEVWGKEFWEKFDKAGWSIFFGDYKYNEENQKTFMVANLIRGMIQRSEHIRKWAFGTILIVGDAAPYKLTCCYLLRGPEMPKIFTEIDDMEYFIWTKANVDSDADRARINMLWAGKYNDEPVYDYSQFK